MFGNLLTLDQELPVQGASASVAARLAAKSQGIDLGDPYGIEAMTQQVMKTLAAQKIETDPVMVKAMVQQALAAQGGGLVQKATDPVLFPTPYVTPTDFIGQYPQPLDPTEILTLCEEISMWKALPEVVTDYQADSWREMTSLAFTGEGLTYLQ